MLLAVRDAVDRRAAINRLRAVEDYATDGATVADMIDGCALLDVVEAGRVVGAVAVRIEGECATITAAASHGIAAYVELHMIEQLLAARGVRRVGVFTRRAGLVRRLMAQGYTINECELSKVIHGQQKIQ